MRERARVSVSTRALSLLTTHSRKNTTKPEGRFKKCRDFEQYTMMEDINKSIDVKPATFIYSTSVKSTNFTLLRPVR